MAARQEPGDDGPLSKRPRVEVSTELQILVPVDPRSSNADAVMCCGSGKPGGMPVRVDGARFLKCLLPGWTFQLNSDNSQRKGTTFEITKHVEPTKGTMHGKEALRMLFDGFAGRGRRPLVTALVDRILKTKAEKLTHEDVVGYDSSHDDSATKDLLFAVTAFLRHETRLVDCPDHAMAFRLLDRNAAIRVLSAWKRLNPRASPGDLHAAMARDAMGAIAQLIDVIYHEPGVAISTDPLRDVHADDASIRCVEAMNAADPFKSRTFSMIDYDPAKSGGFETDDEGCIARASDRRAVNWINNLPLLECHDTIDVPSFDRGRAAPKKGYTLDPLFEKNGGNAPALMCMAGMTPEGTRFPTKQYELRMSNLKNDKVYVVQLANVASISPSALVTMFNNSRDVSSATGAPSVVVCAEDASRHTYESESLYFGLLEAWLDGRTGSISITLGLSLHKSEWTPFPNSRTSNVIIETSRAARAFAGRSSRAPIDLSADPDRAPDRRPWRTLVITNAHMATHYSVLAFKNSFEIGDGTTVVMYGDASPEGTHPSSIRGGVFRDAVAARGVRRVPPRPTRADTPVANPQMPTLVPGNTDIPPTGQLTVVPDLKIDRVVFVDDSFARIVGADGDAVLYEHADGTTRRRTSQDFKRIARLPPTTVGTTHVWLFPDGACKGFQVSSDANWNPLHYAKALRLVKA